MKKRIKNSISLFLATVLVFSLFLFQGCGEKSIDSNADSNDTNKIVCTDGLGRKITLDKTAEKIVVYSPCVNFICALQAQDRIIELGNKKSIERKLTSKLIENISELYSSAVADKSINVEHIVSLKPDLVIIPARKRANLEVLEKANLKVFVVTAESIEQLKSTVLNLSIAFGKDEVGKKFVKYCDDNLAMIKERVEDIPEEKKPKVYFAGKYFLSTSSKTMFQNYMIEYVGGKNVSDELEGERWVKVSPEQVIEWNPDIIFLPQYSTISPKEIMTDSKWKNISAVKNKRVYWFPSNLIAWDYPSVQTILGMLWTAKTINPDKFKDIDIMKKSNEFFNQYFGKSFTELGGSFGKN